MIILKVSGGERVVIFFPSKMEVMVLRLLAASFFDGQIHPSSHYALSLFRLLPTFIPPHTY